MSVYLVVAGGDVPLLVLVMQMLERGVESVWLVEQVDGEIKRGQHSHCVPDELGRRRVVASHSVEQRTRLRLLSEQAAAKTPVRSGFSTAEKRHLSKRHLPDLMPDLINGRLICCGKTGPKYRVITETIVRRKRVLTNDKVRQYIG